MSADGKRLRDAADLARAITATDTHPALARFFGTVADWLESTAERAGYTTRSVDLEHASLVADAILGDGEPLPPGDGRAMPQDGPQRDAGGLDGASVSSEAPGAGSGPQGGPGGFRAATP